MANPIGELRTITSQLKAYFDLLSNNLTTASNPLPSFEDYIASIVYDSTITEALQGEDRAASYSNAALVDATHLFSAINREFVIRKHVKADYFTDAIDDTDKISNYMGGMYGKYVNYYRGTSPEQVRE